MGAVDGGFSQARNMLRREETFSSLADWVFAKSDGQDSFQSPLKSKEVQRSSSFSRLPLDQLLPSADDIPQSDSPEQLDSGSVQGELALQRIDLCRLAALT